MDKQNVVYPYNINIIQRWSTDTKYSVDEPWKYYAKWKKPDTKAQILYDFTYMKCPE